MLDDARIRLEGEAALGGWPFSLMVKESSLLSDSKTSPSLVCCDCRPEREPSVFHTEPSKTTVHVSVVVQPFDSVMSVMLGSSPLPSVSWNAGAVCEAVWMTRWDPYR